MGFEGSGGSGLRAHARNQKFNPVIENLILSIILPRLSRLGCTLEVLELTQHSHQVMSFYIKVTSSYHVASQRMQELLGAIF